jgi:hypothetical protein
MIKVKDITADKKTEIIKYANVNGIYPTYYKYRSEGIKLYPDTIKYWIDPTFKENKKAISRQFYPKVKDTPEYKQYLEQYTERRKLSGDYRKRWLEWYEKNKIERSKMLKQKRIDNLPVIKLLLRDKHRQYMESTTLEQRRIIRSKYYTAEKKLKYYDKCNEKYHSNPVYKLRVMIRNNVARALANNDMSKQCPSHQYLGCSISEFKSYIEAKFVDGMCWENHGRGELAWHLDHIVPLATLKEVNDQEKLKQICHYTNYQPLWEFDNLSKGDTYDCE